MRGRWNIWLSLGVILIAAAVCLSAYNLADDRRAGDAAASAMEQLADADAAAGGAIAVQDLESSQFISGSVPMPTEGVDGRLYIGVLRIPSLGLELPVISDWSYEGLRVAPCRYSGSAYSDDMVVAAHSYASHFGKIHSLSYGAEVSFTDVRGNVFLYEVASIEELGGGDVAAMIESGWDLTLFTCTFDGANRVAVRCEEVGHQL